MTFPLHERIAALHALGNLVIGLPEDVLNPLLAQVNSNNPWFIPSQTRLALASIGEMLDRKKLMAWLSTYTIPDTAALKSVGLVMAGNIPAVGFHDLLCVLVSGNIAHAKLSSTDRILIPWLMAQLIEIEPRFSTQVVWAEQLKGMDAYISTGSDNSARYFEYYFGTYPHIIRKNRSSIAILDGEEQRKDLEKLCRDVQQYFGLGCRNVSKLYIRDSRSLTEFLDAAETMRSVADHHKYTNNYDYNKSIFLVNGVPHLDNGFILLREAQEISSPISVINYEYFTDDESLATLLAEKESSIQCAVSREGWYPGSIPFGEAQRPGLEDYADRVDTLAFLLLLD